MSPGFSMMGSGVYSESATREIICTERCEECTKLGKKCDAVWEEDFQTDDWGNIDQTVTCKKCEHEYTYKEEGE